MYYQELLDDFVDMCREILGKEDVESKGCSKGLIGEKGIENKKTLTGIYLHGSMAMGCFNPEKSDIDLIVVIEDKISDRQKMRFMEQVVRLNERAPAKGLELSIVERKYCRPFVYPTPYELHFSPVHLQWFRDRPEHYIQNMKGEDRDLAAHFTIINRYGIALYGEAVSDVFGEVPAKDYADSIWFDVENAREDIEGNAVYVILNLCRAAAFAREGLCLSKAGGGQWGLKNIADKYHSLIAWALDAYRSDAAGVGDGFAWAGALGGDSGFCGFDSSAGTTRTDREFMRQFAEDMLGEIRAAQRLYPLVPSHSDFN